MLSKLDRSAPTIYMYQTQQNRVFFFPTYFETFSRHLKTLRASFPLQDIEFIPIDHIFEIFLPFYCLTDKGL